jgi:hypothetical protein
MFSVGYILSDAHLLNYPQTYTVYVAGMHKFTELAGVWGGGCV